LCEAGEALTPTHFTGFSIGQLPFSKGVVRAVEQCKAYVCSKSVTIRDRFGWDAIGYGSVALGISRSVPDEFRKLAEKDL
jgi:hypothetical protein